jgi:hypothetical protein
MKTHKANPTFKYVFLQHPATPSNQTQRWTLQDPHLVHPPHSRRRNEPHHPQRKSHRPPLRRRHRLPLGIGLHQVPRPAREDPALDRDKGEPAGPPPPLRQCRPEDIRPLRRPAHDQRAHDGNPDSEESRAGRETGAVNKSRSWRRNVGCNVGCHVGSAVYEMFNVGTLSCASFRRCEVAGEGFKVAYM